MSVVRKPLNTGAFRSLHCLIYKVHVPMRNSRYSTTAHLLCQVLFSTFFKVLFQSSTPHHGSSITIPNLRRFVNTLFSSLKMFRITRLQLETARLIYHLPTPLSIPFFDFFILFFLFARYRKRSQA